MTINMRRAIEAVPPYKRAAAAVKFMSNFVKKHMKAERVRVDIGINNQFSKNSIKKPPVRIRVVCAKDDKNIVTISQIKTEPAGVKTENGNK